MVAGLLSTVIRWDGRKTLEGSEVVRQDITRLTMALGPYKAHQPDDILPYVLKECAVHPTRHLACPNTLCKRNHCQGSGGEQMSYLSIRKEERGNSLNFKART